MEERRKKQWVSCTVPVAATLALAGVAILLCWVMFAGTERSFYEAAAAHSVDTMEVVRDLGIETIDTRVRGVKTDLKTVVADHYDDLLAAGDAAAYARVLSALSLPKDGLDYWYLTTDGALHGADGSRASWPEVMPTEASPDPAADEVQLLGPTHTATGDYVMAAAAPVVSRGKTFGMLIVRLDGYCVSSWIANLRFQAGEGTAYLVDGTGRNIATAREENYEWFETGYNAAELAKTGDSDAASVAALEQRALAGETGLGSYSWEGGTSYIAYGPLEETDWGFYVGFYGDELEEYANGIVSQSNGVAQVAVVLLVIALGAIALFSVRGVARERAANEALTQQKSQIEQQAEQLLVSEERFRVALEKTGNVVVDLDVASGDVLCFTTPEEALCCKATANDLRGALVEGCRVEDESLQLFLEAINDLLHGAHRSSCMLEVRDGSGEMLWYRASLSALMALDGRPLRVIGVLADVTKEREAEYDDLTGLLDRRAAFEAIQACLGAAHSAAICAFSMVDIDRFKEVNDSHGHAVGDEVLRRVAAVLSEVFGAECVVARYGGDEFCAFWPVAPPIERLARMMDEANGRIRAGLADLGVETAVSCSFGVTVRPCSGTKFASLQAQADEALYAAKRAGRCTYAFFDEALQGRGTADGSL